MKITVTNIRSQLNKASMLAWLRARPENERYAPNSACACMYHDMLMDVLDGAKGVSPHFMGVIVYTDSDGSCRRVPLGWSSFASRFQRAAVDMLEAEENDPRSTRPRRKGYLTISRDEAIALAESL